MRGAGEKNNNFLRLNDAAERLAKVCNCGLILGLPRKTVSKRDAGGGQTKRVGSRQQSVEKGFLRSGDISST